MSILVVAPHPDDELLGCGGMLLRHQAEHPSEERHWVIVTDMTAGTYPAERIAKREQEISAIASAIGFTAVHRLGFPPAQLENVGTGAITQQLSNVMRAVKPQTVLAPFRHDVHTDHRLVFDATVGATKQFRASSVRRVLAYETLSETDFALDPGGAAFRPNLFVDISAHLERKLELLRVYEGEILDFPFPRSERAVAALAALRGVAAGVHAAEAFMLLKAIE